MRYKLPAVSHVLDYKSLEKLISVYKDIGVSATEYEGLKSGRKIYNIEYGEGEKILISICGFHGNERSAIQFWCRSLNEIIENGMPKDTKYSIITPANPDGVDANNRYNESGCDLNRDWYDFSQIETRIIRRIIENQIRDSMMVMDHHECHTEPLYFIQDFTNQRMKKINNVFLKELKIKLKELKHQHEVLYFLASRCGQFVNYATSNGIFSLIVENMGQEMGENLLERRMEMHSAVDLAGLNTLGKLLFS